MVTSAALGFLSVCEKLAEQRELGGLGVEAAYPPHAGDRSGN
jgi:hypothetical protein